MAHDRTLNTPARSSGFTRFAWLHRKYDSVVSSNSLRNQSLIYALSVVIPDFLIDRHLVTSAKMLVVLSENTCTRVESLLAIVLFVIVIVVLGIFQSAVVHRLSWEHLNSRIATFPEYIEYVARKIYNIVKCLNISAIQQDF